MSFDCDLILKKACRLCIRDLDFKGTYFFCNEPELGVGIDPGMALTPLPSSIGRGLNPRPSDCEPSAVPLDHGFCQL